MVTDGIMTTKPTKYPPRTEMPTKNSERLKLLAILIPYRAVPPFV
jgi:hypothetical protein